MKRTTLPPTPRTRQRPFTRSHHRASLRGRTATLAGSMTGEPKGRR